MERRSARDAAWESLPDLPLEVEDLLRALLEGMRAVLGDALVGVYLHGSLVAGDFDPKLSDLDLLAAVTSDVGERELGRLREMHDAFALRHPDWVDRIDVTYVSTAALRDFKVRESPIVVISPGEPIHATQTSPGWVMNWHLVRERGVTLLGPSPRSLIARTSADDFVAAVRTHLREMPGLVETSRSPGLHAYAVLTACRGLYACQEGEQASKTKAALWAAERHPDWSRVIRDALDWRNGWRDGRSGDDEARARAVEFVRFAVAQAEREWVHP